MKFIKRFRKAVRRVIVYGLGVPLLNALDWLIARFSRVGNPAVFDTKQFPWVERLEAEWETIRDELLQIMPDWQRVPNLQDVSPGLSFLTGSDGWKSYFLYGYGHCVPSHCKQCPQTARLVESIPDMKTAFFSILAPGMHIPRHRGEYKGLIRCHLGLVVPGDPGDCRMSVDDEMIHWHEGEFVVFDNAYHHEVWNDTDKPRVILLIDIVRPMRFPMGWLNRLIIRLITWSPYVREAKRNHRKMERGTPLINGAAAQGA